MLITQLINPKHNITFGNIKGAEEIGQPPAFVNVDLADQAESLIKACSDLKKESFVLEKKNTDIFFSVHNDKGIWIREKDKINGRILKSVFLKDRKIAKTDTSYSISENLKFFKNKSEIEQIEQYLKNIFEEADTYLLQIRKKSSMPNLHKKIDENLSRIFLDYSRIKLSKPRPKSSILDTISPDVAQNVFELVDEITENLHSIKYPMTRFRVRNEYPSIMQNQKGSKAYEFEGIGPKGENLSIKTLCYTDQKIILMKISKKDTPDKFMVVTSRGEIVKRHLSRFLKNRKSSEELVNPSFKTEDVEDVDMQKYLKIIQKELVSYNDFLINRIKKMTQTKELHMTSQIGSVKKYEQLINNVYKNYTNYKKEITNIKKTEQRNNIKKKFKLLSKQGQPALILQKITPEKEDVFINFPLINGERCTKIIVLKNENEIKKSLLIQGGRLMKFQAKDIHRSARNDREFYYYSQKKLTTQV